MFFPVKHPYPTLPTWETHIPSDTCCLTSETQIRSHVFLTWERHVFRYLENTYSQ